MNLDKRTDTASRHVACTPITSSAWERKLGYRSEILVAEAVDFLLDARARRLDVPLELLHVIDRHPEVGSGDDHSGSIGFNAQEVLLTELAERDAARVREEREQCRVFLHTLRERAIAAGVRTTDMRQRHGELEATLSR